MALAFHTCDGRLCKRKTRRDAIQAAMPQLKSDENLPHEELNLIRPTGTTLAVCYDDTSPVPNIRRRLATPNMRRPSACCPATPRRWA